MEKLAAAMSTTASAMEASAATVEATTTTHASHARSRGRHPGRRSRHSRRGSGHSGRDRWGCHPRRRTPHWTRCKSLAAHSHTRRCGKAISHAWSHWPNGSPKPICNLRVRVRNADPVPWIMHPCAGSWTTPRAMRSGAIPIVVEEVVVDDDTATEPGRSPAPATPTAPATSEEESHPDSIAEAKTIGRVVERWVIAPQRRSPNVRRIIDRNVDHLRICRLKTRSSPWNE